MRRGGSIFRRHTYMHISMHACMHAYIDSHSHIHTCVHMYIMCARTCILGLIGQHVTSSSPPLLSASCLYHTSGGRDLSEDSMIKSITNSVTTNRIIPVPQTFRHHHQKHETKDQHCPRHRSYYVPPPPAAQASTAATPLHQHQRQQLTAPTQVWIGIASPTSS